MVAGDGGRVWCGRLCWVPPVPSGGFGVGTGPGRGLGLGLVRLGCGGSSASRALEQIRFFQAQEFAARNNKMIHNLDPHNLPRLHHPPRQLDVLPAGGHVSRGMVMRQNHAGGR